MVDMGSANQINSIEPGSQSAIISDPTMKSLVLSAAPIAGATLDPSNVYAGSALYDEIQRQNVKKMQSKDIMRKKSKVSKQKLDRKKKIIKKKVSSITDMINFFNTKKVNKSFGSPDHAIKFVTRKKN
jgi:hypothetical protein